MALDICLIYRLNTREFFPKCLASTLTKKD